MRSANAGQAALDLPSAAELFPPRGKSSPAGGFAEWCIQKVKAMIAAPGTPPAAIEWHKGFTANERLFLCELANVAPGAVVVKWADLEVADRARLLAAFERLRHWVQIHERFSVGAEIEDYADSIGFHSASRRPGMPATTSSTGGDDGK